ncbi:MAG: peroxiredoxin [Actinomycetes bacterium]
MALQIGDVAPDFELSNQSGGKVRLSDFRGKKNVVLIFFPMAFTGPCTAELCAVRDEKDAFISDDVVTFGVSCDAIPTLKMFSDLQGYDYDLLSDWWPHGDTARAYGCFLEERGFATRGTFIIDKDGVVRWIVLNTPGDPRSTDDYRAALAAIG